MKILYNEKEVSVLDLGMVKIGETKVYSYTLENDTPWRVKDIELSLKDVDNKAVTEIKFLEAPKSMTGNSKSLLKFSWTPTTEIKKGLKTQLQIKAVEIWD